MRISERIVRRIFSQAGIAINGHRPWDVTVHDNRFFSHVLGQGSLGLGESYMAGWWDCPQLDQFFERILRNGVPWAALLNPVAIGLFLKSRLLNLAPQNKAFVIGKEHYDLGNTLFEAMLDPTMTYSCGYFADLSPQTSQLQAAQIAKLDLVCRKLLLKPGDKVLEIGCGWGSFAYHAATNYGTRVVGLTVSKEQAAFARAKCRSLPVEIRLQDYRDVSEQFDHVVSIGMFEHVGPKNYGTYMKMVKRCLRPDGLFLLHTVGARDEMFHTADPWLRKYIFPIGQTPRRNQIHTSSRNLFEVRDWHEFGRYYDPTTKAWYERFASAWPELKAQYGHRANGQFYRMWTYYLLACSGSFRVGAAELWQVVLAHPNKNKNYVALR